MDEEGGEGEGGGGGRERGIILQITKHIRRMEFETLFCYFLKFNHLFKAFFKDFEF